MRVRGMWEILEGKVQNICADIDSPSTDYKRSSIPPSSVSLCLTGQCTLILVSYRSPAHFTKALSSKLQASASTTTNESESFPCPKPGCHKAYKQHGGLRYHLKHVRMQFGTTIVRSDCHLLRAIQSEHLNNSLMSRILWESRNDYVKDKKGEKEPRDDMITFVEPGANMN